MPVEQFRSCESNQQISCSRELTDLLHGGHILLMEGKKGCTLLMRLAALCDESVMKKQHSRMLVLKLVTSMHDMPVDVTR